MTTKSYACNKNKSKLLHPMNLPVTHDWWSSVDGQVRGFVYVSHFADNTSSNTIMAA